jgi:4-alpha-glucanotransferase
MKTDSDVLHRRRAGVLLHPTSLPGGDLGSDACRFVDFLKEAGLSVWQMLPLGPTHHEDASPYHCLSVHAGNARLISAARLAEWGWIDADVPDAPAADRRQLLHRAHRDFRRRARGDEHAAFEEFTRAESEWLEDYALFEALRKEHGSRPWWHWPPPLRDRAAPALVEARARLAADLDEVRFEQFVFARQWRELRAYAHGCGVRLFGDMPIFVAHDSAEVWAQREYFRLDAAGQPIVVAGVPPDYFSAHGQRWGNPLYRWERMRQDGFRWWRARLQNELARFDLVRVDHFRGFEACWEIPAAEETAVNGRWVEVPGEALFDELGKHFGALPLVAEDLGLITPAVHRLRDKYGFPGMLVLQFAFDGGAENPYLPHNHRPDTVVYTGTHDNDTTRTWFEALPAAKQLEVVDYLGYPHEPMPWPLVRAAFMSVARLAVMPMQDILGLGRGNRMNTPGTTEGNWRWRFEWPQLPPDLVPRLRRMVEMYRRNGNYK